MFLTNKAICFIVNSNMFQVRVAYIVYQGMAFIKYILLHFDNHRRVLATFTSVSKNTNEINSKPLVCVGEATWSYG